MEFYHWPTMVEEHVKTDKKLRKKPRHELYRMELEAITSHRFKNEHNRAKRLFRLAAESYWEDAGRPYYKIHPEMVQMLIKTNLDSIPSQFIETPQNSVLFRFANDIPIRYTTGGVTMLSDEVINKYPVYARSVLFHRHQKTETATNLDEIVIFIDEGFRQKINGIDRLLCNTIVLTLRDDETIPQAIQRTIESEEQSEAIMLRSMRSRLENLFRVIIASGFLANTPEDNLVVPDIINKDKNKYIDAVEKGDEEAIKVIVERAKRRGHNGWNIGTNEIFMGEMEPWSQKAGQPTGNELKHSHIRSGHPHAVRYGPGKKKVKIKWFRPTRVRKDLPFKTDEGNND